MLVLGFYSQDRESTRYEANISNPKVNRDCPPLTANNTSAEGVQISLGGRPNQYIPLPFWATTSQQQLK